MSKNLNFVILPIEIMTKRCYTIPRKRKVEMKAIVRKKQETQYYFVVARLGIGSVKGFIPYVLPVKFEFEEGGNGAGKAFKTAQSMAGEHRCRFEFEYATVRVNEQAYKVATTMMACDRVLELVKEGALDHPNVKNRIIYTEGDNILTADSEEYQYHEFILQRYFAPTVSESGTYCYPRLVKSKELVEDYCESCHEVFKWILEENERQQEEERLAAERKAEEERLAAEKRAEEERLAEARRNAQPQNQNRKGHTQESRIDRFNRRRMVATSVTVTESSKTDPIEDENE